MKTLNATRPGEAVDVKDNYIPKVRDDLAIPIAADAEDLVIIEKRKDEPLLTKKELLDSMKGDPESPKGYGELKVGMEGMLNGVPVRIRKITKKDIVLRPLNRAIRDEHGLMVSFKESKLKLGSIPPI